MKVVSRGLPSRVFTFPLRDRYLPPCLCTSSCTEAAYADIHLSSVTFNVCEHVHCHYRFSCCRSKAGTQTLDAIRDVIGTSPEQTNRGANPALERGSRAAREGEAQRPTPISYTIALDGLGMVECAGGFRLK
jgi:hypothetical protein